MSTAPRRKLSGTFAPAPRSAGLLEALPPTRALRSIDTDPTTTDAGAAVVAEPSSTVVDPTTATADAAGESAVVTAARIAPDPAGTPTDREPQDRQAPHRPSPAPSDRTELTPLVEKDAGRPSSTDSLAATPTRTGGSVPAPDSDPGAPDQLRTATPVTEAALILDDDPQQQVPAQGSADDVVRGVAVYLPPPLLARLKHIAHEQQVTYADVLVQAAHGHGHALAGRFVPTQPPAAAGGMPGRTRTVRTGGGVQVQLRLDGHQIAWLDLTVRQTGAPSRSALVAVLLDAALPISTKRA
jgi:hypothetical protein